MIEKSLIDLEKTVLVGLITKNQTKQVLDDFLDELNFLTFTAGGKVFRRFTQKTNSPDPKYFLGKGKMDELHQYILVNDINSVIFDDELTPTQQLNIEKFLKIKVLDRTGLILDIFAQRAKTSYARNQVELAQYQYLLPRLKGLWTHLERQKGGIGMRGPGETEIETDRRIVRNNKPFFAIILFLILFSFLNYLTPDFMYNEDGSLRQFGLGYKNKTIITGWLISIILAILSYLFVLYYLELS